MSVIRCDQYSIINVWGLESILNILEIYGVAGSGRGRWLLLRFQAATSYTQLYSVQSEWLLAIKVNKWLCVFETVDHKCLYTFLVRPKKTTCKNTHKGGKDILITSIYSTYLTYQTAHPRITVVIHIMIQDLSKIKHR